MILLIFVIIIGSILLIARKKIAGIILVFLGTVAFALFVTSEFYEANFFSSDIPGYLILTIVTSAILLIMALIAKK